MCVYIHKQFDRNENIVFSIYICRLYIVYSIFHIIIMVVCI